MARVEENFKWTKHDLQLLKEALLGITHSFDEIESKLGSTQEIRQAQSFVFFAEEQRFWDSKQNWEAFRKRWNLVEGVDFEILPKGAIVAFMWGMPETKCGIEGRCIAKKWLSSPNMGLGSVSIRIDGSGDVQSNSSLVTTIPFIPSVDLVYSKNMTPQQLREVEGLSGPIRSGLFNPSEKQTYVPDFADIPSTAWFFKPTDIGLSYYDYTYVSSFKYPTMSLPLSQLGMNLPSVITQNGLQLGGGKELPVPPHFDVVCIKFLRFLKLVN